MSANVAPRTRVKVNPFTKTSIVKAKDKKMKGDVLLNFTINFRDEYAAGQPTQEILKNSIQTTSNKDFKAILQSVYASIEQGKTLPDALNEYPICFPLFVRSLFSIANEIGNWTEKKGEKATKRGMLDLIIQQLERDGNIRSKLVSAMVYPSIILGFVALALVLITYFVLPQLRDFFIGMNISTDKLNFSTKALLLMGDFIQKYYWSIPIGLAVIVLAAIGFWRTTGKTIWEENQLNFRVIGKTLRKITLAEVFSLLSILLEAGIPANQALEILGSSCSNKPVSRAIKNVHEKTLIGKNFSESFRDAHEIFKGEPFNILSSAERSGTLDSRPALYAESLLRKAETEIERLISVFPYILLGLVGGVVGVIVIGFYSSFFSIFQIVQ